MTSMCGRARHMASGTMLSWSPYVKLVKAEVKFWLSSEWYFWLARGSCGRYEGVSIDDKPLVSIDTDARRRVEPIS
ncbi:hypothetical protein F2Q70_00021693 [Brassica cretica]|uniref:Uncharacterized protein n=2 Tax=Brassica cretica TaxID=69181 RepID=A0A8S9GR03_BRACR|nr:hypothetical protein F2Q70_00021693 [Brassica cretica]KAF3583387.1 hypothetical protein F2Q69_00029164 [Brassica cretica]KAF3607465.1 hypothetical protein DY000_02048021 [Brassica cretica]